MGARWYDPALGRWLSADTLVPDSSNPQSFNRFSYVLGNPLVFVDPTGHEEEGACTPGYENETCEGQQAVYEAYWQHCTETGWAGSECQGMPAEEAAFWFLVSVGGITIVEDAVVIGFGLLGEGAEAVYSGLVNLSAKCLTNPTCAAIIYGVSSQSGDPSEPIDEVLYKFTEKSGTFRWTLREGEEAMSLARAADYGYSPEAAYRGLFGVNPGPDAQYMEINMGTLAANGYYPVYDGPVIDVTGHVSVYAGSGASWGSAIQKLFQFFFGSAKPVQ